MAMIHVHDTQMSSLLQVLFEHYMIAGPVGYYIQGKSNKYL